MHGTSSLLLLLLLLCEKRGQASSSCMQELPLHAVTIINSTLCAWECNAGYYRTKPGGSSRATCRHCAGGGMWQPCTAMPGWYLQPCSANENAKCVPCPPLSREGQTYTNTNNNNNTASACQSIGCMDGYYPATTTTNTSLTCKPCERGFYCRQGGREQCGSNCTTVARTATNVLECEISLGIPTTVFSISALISLPSSVKTINQTVACPLLESTIISWAQYGYFSGCLISFSAATSSSAMTTIMGTLICETSVAPCIAGQYTQWLTQLLKTHDADIHRLVRECIGVSNIFLGTAIIQKNSPGTSTTRVIISWPSLNNIIQQPPMLVYEQQRWGKKKSEALSMFMWVAAACFSLLLILMAGCGLMCFKIKRKHGITALYDKLMGHAVKRNKHWPV